MKKAPGKIIAFLNSIFSIAFLISIFLLFYKNYIPFIVVVSIITIIFLSVYIKKYILLKNIFSKMRNIDSIKNFNNSNISAIDICETKGPYSLINIMFRNIKDDLIELNKIDHIDKIAIETYGYGKTTYVVKFNNKAFVENNTYFHQN